MERLTARLPCAEDIMHAGRVALSTLAIAASGPAVAAEAAEAIPDYAAPISPALAQPVQDGQHNNWVEVDNAPYGYYLGEFNTTSDKARVLAVTDQGDYAYLAIRMSRGDKTVGMCGWARTTEVTVGGSKDTADFPDCMKQITKLSSFQFSFGHGFNCPPGACNDGKKVDQTEACDGVEYRNDLDLDLATTGVPFRDTRKIKHPLFDVKTTIGDSDPIFSRFVPLDNKAVVARTDDGGWGLLKRECAPPGTPHGGPPNSDRERKKHLAATQ